MTRRNTNIVVLLFVLLMATVAPGGLVILTNGKTHTGRVIVRYRVITVRSDDLRLYQFHDYMVHRVEIFPPTATARIAVDDGFLYKLPDTESEVANSFYRGMEFDIVETRGGWSHVRGVRPDDEGWVPNRQLGLFTEWNPLNPEATQPDRRRLLEAYERVWGGTKSRVLPLPGTLQGQP